MRCSWFVIAGFAVVTSAWAQPATVVEIDLYGVRSLDPSAVHETLEFSVGDAVELDVGAIEGRLREVPGIAEARLTRMLLGGDLIVVVVVREDGVAPLTWLAPPVGEVRLPRQFVDDHDEVMRLHREAIEKRVLGEDRIDGYSVSKYPPAREIQQRYPEIATRNLERLADVLATSADAEHRAVAAYWIAFAEDHEVVAAALERAVLDPEWQVRNNATRALAVLVEYSHEHPELELRVPPGPFLAMLDSTDWTDLNKASMMLLTLTASRDPEVCDAVRARGIDGLLDIARWTSTGHAYAAVSVLGRLAGMEDEETGEAYRLRAGDREERKRWLADVARRARQSK